LAVNHQQMFIVDAYPNALNSKYMWKIKVQDESVKLVRKIRSKSNEMVQGIASQ